MQEHFKLTDPHTLYRCDAFELPTTALRRLKVTLVSCHVSSGDLLILKSDKTLLNDEKLKLSLHVTTTGLSEDSNYLRDIDVSREISLNELKEIVSDSIDCTEGVDHIRLREKNNNMFFGRILRDSNKSLK